MQVMESLIEHYDWQFFEWWLGDESYFDQTYKNVFQSELATELTQQQTEIIEKSGRNLEDKIRKWTFNNEIDIEDLSHKIYEYITYQLKRQNIRDIIGVAC